MNKTDYKVKLDEILKDQNKFVKIRSDPTLALKRKINRLIDANNALQGNLKLAKLSGHYSPGYLYGNAKVHKNRTNPPLRPIISQVTSPTYTVAKELNNLIKPYLSKQYSIQSTDEFLDILQSTDSNGTLASLDVESLFTNVPIDETINTILNSVYNHQTLPPLKVSRNHLEQLLRACTQEAPFKHIDGSIYVQKGGVTMGSPLGPLFANFYMASIEENILNNNLKPKIYCRYVDDIFLLVEDENKVIELKDKFESNSILKFTYEMGSGNRLAFLDVNVSQTNNSFDTSVYVKSTNIDDCLNYRSDAPDQYKKGVITTLLHRAYKISSSWANFTLEIDRIKQLLVNNYYSNRVVDEVVKQFVAKKMEGTEERDSPTHKIFYENQFNNGYKTDERVLQDIFKTHIVPRNSNKIKLNIFYKSKKVSNYIIKNNISLKFDKLKTANVVYEIKCNIDTCNVLQNSYIGHTTNQLTRRMTEHLSNGAVKDHFLEVHKRPLTRGDLVKNVEIIAIIGDRNRLSIYEALSILKQKPYLNKQLDLFLRQLKLFITN